MQPSSVFNHGNNNNHNTNTKPGNIWGNNQLGNNPFSGDVTDQEPAFPMWNASSSVNTSASEPFGNGFSASFGTANSTHPAQSQSQSQSVFAHASASQSTATPWWSTSTSTTNTTAQSNHSKHSLNTPAQNDSNSNTGDTGDPLLQTESDTTFATFPSHRNGFANSQFGHATDTKPSATNGNKHRDGSLSVSPLKPHKQRPPPTENSTMFLGNWNAGKNGFIHVQIKHKQTDGNVLVALKDKQAEYEIEVTGFGVARRTEQKTGRVSHGVAHLNTQRSGALSMLWHDGSGRHQHYWNQGKCNNNSNGESGPCKYGVYCKYAHLDEAAMQRLQSNNAKVAELQQQQKQEKQSKQQPPQQQHEHEQQMMQTQSQHSLATKTGPMWRAKPQASAASASDNSHTHAATIATAPQTQPSAAATTTAATWKPKTQQSRKNPRHKTEGMSWTTTVFDANDHSTGTFLSTQDPATSNSTRVPQPPQSNTDAPQSQPQPQYAFQDDAATTTTAAVNGNNTNATSNSAGFTSWMQARASPAAAAAPEQPRDKIQQRKDRFKHTPPVQQQQQQQQTQLRPPPPPPVRAQSQSRSQSPNVTTTATVDSSPGECYLMCPRKESEMRIANAQCKRHFEMDALSQQCTPFSLVKEYSKSNAGQQTPLQDVRCGSVLRVTLQYLMNHVLNLTHIPFAHRFSFLEDRMRAIVKDVYIQQLGASDKECTIELLETSVRFRIFSHVLICHMDQHVSQQERMFPASTMARSRFLAQNVNEKSSHNSFFYSAAQNLEHLPNIFSNLFHFYKSRSSSNVTTTTNDEIEIYCLAAYHQLVDGALKFSGSGGATANYHQLAKKLLCLKIPSHARSHARIRLARRVMDAYSTANRALFFKLYGQRLTIMEQAVLFPLLDHFRLICIRVMSKNKAVRMAGLTTYAFADFLRGFGFFAVDDDGTQSKDAVDFLSWYGSFTADEVQRIQSTGLNMADFARLRPCPDGAQRFPARDAFLQQMESVGMQRLLQSSSYLEIDARAFQALFEQLNGATDKTTVDAAVNALFEKRKTTTTTNTDAKAQVLPQSNSGFKPTTTTQSWATSSTTQVAWPTAPQTQSQTAATLNNFNSNDSWTQASQPQSAWPASTTTTTSTTATSVKRKPSLNAVPTPIPSHNAVSPLETMNDIISKNEKLLQSLLQQSQWTQFKQKTQSLKSEYQSHVEWHRLQCVLKKYAKQYRTVIRDELQRLIASPKNWRALHAFHAQWHRLEADIVAKAVMKIKQDWFRFQQHDRVYYRRLKYAVTRVEWRQLNEAPKLTLSAVSDGDHSKSTVVTLDMFDAEIVSESEFERQQKLEQERARKDREQLEKTERERREQQRVVQLERERQAEQQRLLVQQQEELSQKREQEQKASRLREKLAQQAQQKRARLEREQQQTSSLRRCRAMYAQVRVRAFVKQWKQQAAHLSRIRQHYRINDEDDDLLSRAGTSMNTTLQLLQAHSPKNSRSRSQSRKRSLSQMEAHTMMATTAAAAGAGNEEEEYVHEFERGRRKRAKQKPPPLGVSSWDSAHLMHLLAARNAQWLTVVNANSRNENDIEPAHLVFNVMISTAAAAPQDSFAELVLQYFAVDATKRLHKQVLPSAENHRKLHLCAICDDKIRQLGARQQNCVRGFQSYVHVCENETTAMLDFDDTRCVWSLSEQYRDGLRQQLRAQRARAIENLTILHDCSDCSVLVLVQCQPLFTAVRYQPVATDTLIEFDDWDTTLIVAALQLDKLDAAWSVKVLGVPSWPDAACAATFKFGLSWLVRNAPPYPIVYRHESRVLRTAFETIFDSHLFDETQKIKLWNDEMDKVAQNIARGMDTSVSWPPCSMDDSHELVLTHILPPFAWNDAHRRRKVRQDFEALKVSEHEHEHAVKQHIVKAISGLDKCWWTTTETITCLELSVDSPVSNTSTFATLSTFTYDQQFDAEQQTDKAASTRQSQLSEFDALVNNVSNDFDQTLHGLQSCTTVVKAIQTRMNGFQ